MPEPRKTFGPVVGLGLASGILTAVASSKTWLDYDDAATRARLDPLLGDTEWGQMPLAAALSLVVLACWGVILVTRGRVRRVVAVLAGMASIGVLAAVVYAWFLLPDQRPEILGVSGANTSGLAWTAWYWAAAVGAALSLAATTLAVRWAPAWPEMGRRYDAPGATQGSETTPEEPSSLDLWKSIDEGRDPTVGSG
jgi:uncharacterized membrane protein (TIGR02234 family)